MRLLFPTVILIGGMAIMGCDDNDESGSNVTRYCDLTAELDQAGEEVFAELEADPDATEEDFMEAERQFIEDHRADLDELRDVAPDEIAADVDTLLDTLLEVAEGNLEARESEEAQQAEERITQFEEENCPAPASS